MNKTIKNLIIAMIITIPSIYALTIIGTTSSHTFTLANCTANPNITYNCTPDTIRYECDIYNPSFINTVSYRINGIDYGASENGTNPSQFYLLYNKQADTSSNTNPITMDRQQITDVNNEKLNLFSTITLNHNCAICTHTYTNTTIQACNTSNQQIIQYASSNESCAPSFNQTENCNYCTPNIFSNSTECNQNGTKTISYFDTNYASCCLSTGLQEDCIINTNTYSTHNETCNYYSSEFICKGDITPIINDKINLNCELPDNQDYACVVNTYQGQNYTSLLATTPEYKSTTNILFAGQSETRTSFTPTNRLLNAYYTNKGLRGENTYKIQVVCTNANTTLKSEYQINPIYDTPDYAVTRLQWAKTNSNYLFLFGFFIFIGVALLIYVIKKIK